MIDYRHISRLTRVQAIWKSGFPTPLCCGRCGTQVCRSAVKFFIFVCRVFVIILCVLTVNKLNLSIPIINTIHIQWRRSIFYVMGKKCWC